MPIVGAPLIGGSLLAIGEFGYWSFELQAPIRPGESVILNRLALTLGLVVAGGALSAAATSLTAALH